MPSESRQNPRQVPRFRDWIDVAPFAYGVATLTAQLEFANSTLCNWLGYSRREVLTKRRTQLIDAESLPALDAALAALDGSSTGTTSLPVDLVRRDGQRLPVELHCRRRDAVIATEFPRIESFAFKLAAPKSLEKRLPAVPGQLAVASDASDARRKIEREELAFRLHDSTAQDLCGLQLEIATLCQTTTDQPEVHKRLLDLEQDATRAAAAVYELMREFRAVDEPHNGLLELINSSIAPQAGRSEIKITLQHELDTDISTPPARAIGLSSIEAIRNATKHAGCTRIAVRVKMSHDQLVVVIADDGQGHAVHSTRHVAAGFGLRSIAMRLLRVGGRARFWSRPGQGSIVVLSLASAQALRSA